MDHLQRRIEGHGTDVALIGGILGFETDDLRIPEALEIAKRARN